MYVPMFVCMYLCTVYLVCTHFIIPKTEKLLLPLIVKQIKFDFHSTAGFKFIISRARICHLQLHGK